MNLWNIDGSCWGKKGMPIIKIPYDFYGRFNSDPYESCRNILSIPLGAVSPFFENIENVKRCIDSSLLNPFNDSFVVFDDNFICTDDFPRYMHIDLSAKHDGTGISMAHVVGFKDVVSRDDPDVESYVRLPIIQFDFVGKLVAESGTELLISDIREMVINELSRRGFNIRLITFDRWGSIETIQTLSREGYATDVLSLDRTSAMLIVDYDKPNRVRRESTRGNVLAAWNSLKDAITDGRVTFPFHPAIETEAKHAERRIKGSRVMIDCQSSSLTLDLLESMAGTIYNCTNNEHEFMMSDKEIVNDADIAASSFYKDIGRSQDTNIFDSELVDNFYSNLNPKEDDSEWI